MTLHHLVGHHEARRRLARAHAQGRLPQVLLVSGPKGVGKQRLALWLAQLIFCEVPGEEPCGDCRQCQLVTRLGHVDLHWMVPILRPKAADHDRQVEEAALLVAQAVDERRKTPLYGPPDGMASHGVAVARLIARRASLTPVEGRRKVFIVGDAERLVPQEASPEAANALLKLLEEPPADTVFILTAADPKALLPTVRSRAVPRRLGPLADDEVRGFLASQVDPPLEGAVLDERVALAEGSIGRALWEVDEAAKARAEALEFLGAALGDRAQLLDRALKQAPWSARGDFTGMLQALGEALSDAARTALAQEPRRPVPGFLHGREPAALARALTLVADAEEAAQGNVNPQLLLAVLGERLGATL
ncbi:MAG: hypothetical protein E4H37_04245 [Gemmatimonadales bacterium]|nr:MAG: hypothetical protein E4H37_04245 [Gemmatimonadales bacterium]